MRWFPGLAAAFACAVVTQPDPSAAAVQQQPNCRQFTRTVKIDGRNQKAVGQACQQPDGSWQIVQGDTATAGAAPQQGYAYPSPYYANPYPYPYPYPYYWTNGWGSPFYASFFFGNRFGGFHHFGHDGFRHGGGHH